MAYKPFEESKKTRDYGKKLAETEAQKPVYTSKYQSQLDSAIDKYLNRDEFTFDLNGDALYNQYKDQYTKQGKLAMQDTMGQAAALTGGYGSSYGVTAGNQAYQAYLGQLNNVIPELYQMAYDRYRQEGDDLLNQYNLLYNQESLDYGKYRDSVGDWQNMLGYYSDAYNQGRSFDYGMYADDRNMSYQQERDAVNDEWRQKEFDEQVRQYNEQFDWAKSQAGRSGGGPVGIVTGTKNLSADELDAAIATLQDKGLSEEDAKEWLYQAYGSQGYSADQIDYILESVYPEGQGVTSNNSDDDAVEILPGLWQKTDSNGKIITFIK